MEYNGGLCEWTGIDFLEFRPSEVAAAVALYVSGELHTVQFDDSSFSPLFSPLQKVNEVPLLLSNSFSLLQFQGNASCGEEWNH